MEQITTRTNQMNSTMTKPTPEESTQNMDDTETLEDGARIVNENADEDVAVDELPEEVKDLFDEGVEDSTSPSEQDYWEENILNTTVEVEKNAERALTTFVEETAQLTSDLSLMAEKMNGLGEEVDNRDGVSYAVEQRHEAVTLFVTSYHQMLQRFLSQLGGDDQ